jgi:hypothetical protein
MLWPQRGTVLSAISCSLLALQLLALPIVTLGQEPNRSPKDIAAAFGLLSSKLSPSEYDRLVDAMLDSDEYQAALSSFWMEDLLRSNERTGYDLIAKDWLVDQVANDTLLDDIPTTAEENRIIVLLSAMESIQKNYDDEVAKVIQSDVIASWYDRLPGMPTPDENSLRFDWKVRSGRDNESITVESSSRVSFCMSLKIPNVLQQRTILASCMYEGLDRVSQAYSVGIDQGRLFFQAQGTLPVCLVSIESKSELPVDQWIHVAIVVDPSSALSPIQAYVDGERVELNILQNQLLWNEEWRDKKHPLKVKLGPDPAGQSDPIETRQFQMYLGCLTPIEIASLASGKRMLPWEELNDEQRKAWRTHYVERQDQRCRYHLESLHHYEATLAGITRNRLGMFLFWQELRESRNQKLGSNVRMSETVPKTASLVCNKLWSFAIGRPHTDGKQDIDSTVAPARLRSQLILEGTADGFKQKVLLKKILLSEEYRKIIQSLSEPAK